MINRLRDLSLKSMGTLLRTPCYKPLSGSTWYRFNFNVFQAEETVMPYLNAMADFRDNVRRAARELKATEILKECDRLRDDVLPDLGVRLEDKV